MTQQYRISTTGRTFGHGGAALLWARRQYPDAVWGAWHQAPNGRVRIVGRVPGREADDPIVIERVR